jgi:hypothetical protein
MFCYNGSVMAQQTASERVRQRLTEWAKTEGWGARKTLAEASPGKYGKPRTIQWASGVIKGRQKLRLDDLDVIAELLQVPPGDLVRRNHDHYLELIPSEMRFVMHLRSIPDTVRQHLMHVAEYFFGFQERLLKEQKATVDKRTKAARVERERRKTV